MRHLAILSSSAILAFSVLVDAGASSAAPAAAPAPAAASAPAKEAAAAAAAAGPAKVVGPPDVAWKDMSSEQKGKFMKAVVQPKMKVVFQEFDGKAFAKFNCATCHGKEAKAHKFKMPNPEIHSLPGTHEAFEAAMKKEPTWPKWAQFMGEKVKPQVATLLGMPEFDPKKPEAGGFGCQNCHTIEKP
jgi:hypothetical protein